jgi:hypothetical protein
MMDDRVELEDEYIKELIKIVEIPEYLIDKLIEYGVSSFSLQLI